MNEYMTLREVNELLDVGRQRVYQLIRGDTPTIRTKKIDGVLHYKRLDVYQHYANKHCDKSYSVDFADISRLFEDDMKLKNSIYCTNPNALLQDVLFDLKAFFSRNMTTLHLLSDYLQSLILYESRFIRSMKAESADIQIDDFENELLHAILNSEKDIKIDTKALLDLNDRLVKTITRLGAKKNQHFIDFTHHVSHLIKEMLIIMTNVKEGGLAHVN